MTLRDKLYHIVFGTDTKAGRRFDLFLLWAILFSIVVVMLESVPSLGETYIDTFTALEWGLTILFTTEYLLRIWISPKPASYIFSWWGLIDLASILPTFLSLFFVGYHYLLIVRIFRLLRIFRILKLVQFNNEAQILLEAFRLSFHKISIFLLAVIAIVTFMGTIMYVVEGGEKGFSSIPHSIYWAVVTVTTVGYGDIVPQTDLGRFISAVAMVIGYAIIAVPTGIVTVGLSKSTARGKRKKCSNCGAKNRQKANFCDQCGEKFLEKS